MELSVAIEQRCQQLLSKDRQWYMWDIDHSKLPPGITVSGNHSYAQNVHLKEMLSKAWQAAKENTKEGRLMQAKLEAYYIGVWGGVRSNKQTKLEKYFGASASELMANGHTGIASWSKALTVRDYKKYAIYDARVAASLVALQIIHNVDQAIIFPLVPSRNRTVANGIPLLKKHYTEQNWKSKSVDFYDHYLAICREVAERLQKKYDDVELCTVEMILFASAEELIRQAFPGKDDELNKKLPSYRPRKS